jgi:hypothetical protein
MWVLPKHILAYRTRRFSAVVMTVSMPVIASSWGKKCESVHKRGKHFGVVQKVPGGHQKSPNAIVEASI